MTRPLIRIGPAGKGRWIAWPIAALVLPALLVNACLGNSDELLQTEVDGDQKAYAVALGREVLETYFDEGREAALAVTLEPAADGMDQPGPRLYVTLRNNGTLRASMSAETQTFAGTIRNAVVAAIEDERFGGVLQADELATTRLEFNAITNGTELSERTVEGLSSQIEAGRHAFEFTHPDGSAFFKETVMITHNYDYETAFQELCDKAGLAADCYTWPETAIERFEAEHWVEATDDPAGYYELFRGHRIVTTDNVTPETIGVAARLNAGYVVTHQLEDGSIDYLYDPTDDSLVNDQNTVRQAGGSYFLSKAATWFGEEGLTTAARAAVDNLLSYEQTNDSGSYISWQGAKLGTTALTLLGIVELRTTEDYNDAAFRLANGIVGQQLASGRLQSNFDSDSDPDSSQQFYAGESLLALSRALDRYGDQAPQAWWNAVELAFDYYVNFWRMEGESAFVPWQAAAWANIYFLTGESRYADFVFELLDWSLERQNLASYGMYAKDDYAGAIQRSTDTPPTMSTGTHLEPVPLGAAVARELGDTERADRYAEAIRHGLRFVLQLVITDRETFYMADATRALGGVRTSLTDALVRIDNIQHVGTAMLHSLIYLPDDPVLWGTD